MRESAGGVVVGKNGKIVLVEQHGNSWTLPKGGVEEGETKLEAAKREIAEEAGITRLELIAELGSYVRHSISRDGKGESSEWPATKRTFFLFTTDESEVHPSPDDPHQEITEARWSTIEEALTLLTHPKDQEFLQENRDTIEKCLKER